YWLKASQYMAVSNDSSNKDAATELVDFFTNNEEANDIMKVERGVPINKDLKKSLKESDDLTEPQRESVEFVEEVEDIAEETPPFDPDEVQNIYDLLDDLGEGVLFEEITPEEAAENFVEEGNSILG